MVIKCNNGHWYDSNVDLVCPHCKRENGKLAIKLDDKEEDDKTVSFIDVAEGMEGLDRQIEKSIASVNNEVSDDFDFDMADIDIEDSDKTIALGFFGVSEEIQPVTGWLEKITGCIPEKTSSEDRRRWMSWYSKTITSPEKNMPQSYTIRKDMDFTFHRKMRIWCI